MTGNIQGHRCQIFPVLQRFLAFQVSKLRQSKQGMYFDSLGLNYRVLCVIGKFTISNGGNCPVERSQ